MSHVDPPSPPPPAAEPDATVLAARPPLGCAPLPAPGGVPTAPAATHIDPGFAPAPKAADAPSGPGRVLGPYRIEGRLGEGGMGVVYRGTDLRLRRPVAVKFMREGVHASAEERERFLREPRAAARLTHPGIVQIYDTGECEGAPYFAMEFVEGRTLGARIQAGDLGFRETAELLQRTAEALEFAHRQGVIHRDLKPENIMLRADQPMLMDFGLAKSAAEVSRTATGTVMGTPHYMSPEQAAGEVAAVDARSDVYSLGVVLFECLTGRPPFHAQDPYEVIAAIRRDEPPFPRRLRPETPADLEKVCLKAMAKERARRYATAGEMAADLGRWLAGLPVVAVPPSRLYRARKWAARNRSRVAAFAFGVAIVSVLLAGQVYSSLRERALRERTTALRLAAEARLPALATQAPESAAFRDAEAAVLALLAVSPGDPDARVWLARARARRGDAAGARAELDRALAAHPQHAEARLCKAWLLFEALDDRPGAIATLAEGPAPDAGTETGGCTQVLLAWAKSGPGEALETARRGLTHWPALPEAQRIVAEAILAANIPSDVRTHAVWAVARLDEYLAAHPEDAAMFAHRAEILLTMDREEPAIADLERALRAGAAGIPAAEGYVDYLRHQGRCDEALDWLGRARTAGLSETRAAATRCRIERQRGDRAAALAHGLAALRAGTAELGAVIDACAALHDLGLDEPGRAAVRAELERVDFPESSERKASFAFYLLRFGLKERAERILVQVEAAHAETPMALRLRARRLTETDRDEEAIEAWTRVTEALPGDPEGFEERARLRLRDLLRKPGTAKAVMGDLTRAIRLGSGDEDLFLIRATLWTLAGKRREAIADIAEYALRHAPLEFAGNWADLGRRTDLLQRQALAAVQAFAPDLAAELSGRGDAAAAAGEWGFAHRCHSLALVARPDHAPSLLGMAHTHARNDPHAAVLFLDRAVRCGTDPDALRKDARFSVLRDVPGFDRLGK